MELELTRDEGLMVLNDHCGERVRVSVDARIDGRVMRLGAALGTLRHWHDDPEPQWTADLGPELRAMLRADSPDGLAALYAVGAVDQSMADLVSGNLFTLSLMDATSATLTPDENDEVDGVMFFFGPFDSGASAGVVAICVRWGLWGD